MPPLEALAADGHEVVLVVSRPDRRRGRGGHLLPSPVKAAALRLGLAVTERVEDVIATGAQLGVVVAFGRLVRPPVLAAVPMVNVHFSLLPRWRGAAPVERAILAGDPETGVCLMALEEGLDTGPVYERVTVPIGPEETAEELRRRLVDIGTAMLVRRLRDGLGQPVPQQGEPTYAAKIEPSELHLDWAQPALRLHRTVRLGRAWTTFRQRRFMLLRAAPGPPRTDHLAPGQLDGLDVGTGDGSLRLQVVQLEGRQPQPAEAWLSGARLQPGERLGA